MHETDIKQIDVKTTSPYSVFVGECMLDFIKERIKGKKNLILTDSNVFSFHEKYLNNISKDIFVLKAGEESKNYRELLRIYDFLIDRGADRYSRLVCVGGGVVGDIGGFAASTYMRGIGLVHVPTSLLAMVDSSIGGKTAINYGNLKNIIGSFYQPEAVFVDVSFLKTLPDREYISAFAEIVKYGIIRDKELFEFLGANIKAIRDRNDKVIRLLIEKSIKNKVEVVEADEKEKGLRTILNFGHTFAHAIESLTEYKVYLHGEAVAIGMIMALGLSKRLELIDDSLINQVRSLLEGMGLPYRLDMDIKAEEAYEIMLKDKKNKESALRFILTRGVGNSIISSGIAKEVIMDAINEGK
ncbi:3-dehydroquinate synthase [Hippea maritima]|uniref:3-dehydroquinate synthase n=1 Tax=Hippea maritima (strain ATCC 700847 / DSM 10411 / MH2) TaxID=760142 RepID=F2LXL8_HIPMA|nr:3-dehydroquinate synthase [Hippea maritima]AEA33204.1 3-dehydroquinate synthase [Hippea maritima DSM 10411]